MKVIVIIALVGIFAGIKGETDKCNIGDFRLCMPDSLKTADIGNNLLPNEEFLDRYCSPAISFFQCVKSLMEKCELETLGFHPDVKNELLSGIQLANQLCDADSTLRQAYVEIIPCINANPQKFVQCAKNTTELAIKFADNLETETMAKSKVFKCTNTKLLERCTIYEASKVCDTQVLNNVMQVIEIVDDVIRENICPEDVLELYGDQLFVFVMANPEYIFEFMAEEKRRK